jgi:hypothetical protein
MKSRKPRKKAPKTTLVLDFTQQHSADGILPAHIAQAMRWCREIFDQGTKDRGQVVDQISLL